MVGKLARALLAVIAAFAFATQAQAEWHRAESQHFIVYGDMSESDLRTRTERLERFDAMMRLLFNVEDTVKVQVFMLPSITDVQKLADNPNIGGFYNATAQLAYGFVPADLGFYQEGYTAENVMMHEYAHHMLLSGIDRYVPGWATEGLATMFMTAKLDNKGGITIGAPNPAFSISTYSGSRWSIEKLLASDKEKIAKMERDQLYSRGWALAHYLWMSGERPGQYAKFLALLNQSGDPIAAGKEAFGDLDKLNREVNAYLRRSSFPASSFSAEQLKTPTEIAVRELTPGEEAILEHRMVSLLGVDKEKSVKLAQKARPVGARFPNDPFVQRAMAEIEYDVASLNDGVGFAAADAAADRALAADPQNVMAMAYKGRIAAQRAIETGNEGYWREARGWFLKANKAEPNHPLPFVLFYDSFLAAGELASKSAVGGLYRAAVLMPQDPSVRARAAIELVRSDDLKRARSFLAPAAFNPHVDQDNPMRDLINKIDEGADAEAVLAWIRQEKFDKRFNDFLGAEIAEEDEEEAKKEGKKKE